MQSGVGQLNKEDLQFILENDPLAIMGARDNNPQTGPFLLGKIWKRIAARLFDLLFVYMCCVVFFFMFSMIAFISIPESKIDNAVLDCFENLSYIQLRSTKTCSNILDLLSPFLTVGFIFNTMFFILYFLLLPVYGKFGTIGKYICKLKVINNSKKDTTLKLFQNFKRELIFFILQITILIRTLDMLYSTNISSQSYIQKTLSLVELFIFVLLCCSTVYMFFSPKQQSCCDKLSKTIVIDTSEVI
jgi:uncharacterized RDD family membrane protein YckC